MSAGEAAPSTIPTVDDQRLGAALRIARIRRRLRQSDVALAAGVSDVTVSRIERGHVDAVAVGLLRRVAAALDVRIELAPRSRASDLDRLVNARHAALAEETVRLLTAGVAWVVRPEVSFAWYGERGVIDLLAFHEPSSSLLVIEVKTEVVDVGELFATLGRKRRLAAIAAEPFAWTPVSVSTWLVIADSMTNRRRVAAHRSTFRAALPHDGRTLRAWLRAPAGRIDALSFVSDRHPGKTRSGFATPRRVSVPARSHGDAGSGLG